MSNRSAAPLIISKKPLSMLDFTKGKINTQVNLPSNTTPQNLNRQIHHANEQPQLKFNTQKPNPKRSIPSIEIESTHHINSHQKKRKQILSDGDDEDVIEQPHVFSDPIESDPPSDDNMTEHNDDDDLSDKTTDGIPSFKLDIMPNNTVLINIQSDGTHVVHTYEFTGSDVVVNYNQSDSHVIHVADSNAIYSSLIVITFQSDETSIDPIIIPVYFSSSFEVVHFHANKRTT